MNKIHYASLCCLALLLSACGSDDDATTANLDEGNPLSEQSVEQESPRVTLDEYNAPVQEAYTALAPQTTLTLTEHLQTLGFEYLNEFQTEDYAGNLVFSPFYRELLWAKASLGAKGQTLTALLPEWSPEGAGYYEPLSYLEQASSLLANHQTYRLFGQSDYLFSHDYLNAQSELFAPELFEVDFVSGSQVLRQDVSTAPLEGTIRYGHEKSRLLLAQSAGFELNWSAGLDAEIFTGSFQSYLSVFHKMTEMVRLTGFMTGIETPSYRAVEIPLADSPLALLVVEPKESELVDLVSLFASPGEQKKVFAERDAEFALQETSVALPLVAFEGPFDFGFSRLELNQDDFSGINSLGHLELGSYSNEAYLAISEQGIQLTDTSLVSFIATEDEPETVWNSYSSAVEMLSVTIVDSLLEEGMKTCRLTRDQGPFVYVFYDTVSLVPYFIGTVSSVSGELEEVPTWQVPVEDDCGTQPE